MTRSGTAPKWPADVAVPSRSIAVRESLPVCATWVLPLKEVRDWFEAAKPGERLRYARGPQLARGETSAYVGGLARQGLAEPSQPRAQGCYGFDFFVAKLGDARAAPRPLDDPATRAILAELRRAARRGERCPSDRELAAAAGLPTKRAAGWRVTALRDSGALAIETATGPSGPWRTIRFADGTATAGAPEDSGK